MESTICFFRKNEKGIVEPIGSGVFIEYKNNYFIVTSGHMINDWGENFIILTDKEFSAGGEIKISKNDKIDVAVMKLDDYSSESLKNNFVALPQSMIDFKHNLIDFDNYFLLGFPITKTKQVWQKKEIKSESFSYQTRPNFDFNYEKNNLSPENNIAVKFTRKNVTIRSEFIEKAPNLEGISGSGLWFLINNEISLIGIVIEEITDRDKVNVVATKIKHVIEACEIFLTH